MTRSDKRDADDTDASYRRERVAANAGQRTSPPVGAPEHMTSCHRGAVTQGLYWYQLSSGAA